LQAFVFFSPAGYGFSDLMILKNQIMLSKAFGPVFHLKKPKSYKKGLLPAYLLITVYGTL
jgi:hypothetical protein